MVSLPLITGTLPGITARVNAPLTVLAKPVVTEFQLTETKKAADGSTLTELKIRGRFYRNRNGETRTDFFDLSKPEDSVGISMIWHRETKTMTMLSFAERAARRMERPAYPSEHKWTPRGAYTLQFTSEEKIIHGLECTRVLLVPIPGHEPEMEGWQNETWIASGWGIPMLDVAKGPIEDRRWEVFRVEKVDPDSSVFNIPETFTLIE